MTKPFSISLKQGERIFINGAVVRVDRKVSIEFLNDVNFLLEAHVMQPEQTTTPLRQLYFIVQTMLMDPSNANAAMPLFDSAHDDLCTVLVSPDMQAALTEVRRFVDAKRYFDALKTLRGSFAREDDILHGAGSKRIKLAGAIG
jgi:flagellar biosynthesis repressor protein FlbT